MKRNSDEILELAKKVDQIESEITDANDINEITALEEKLMDIEQNLGQYEIFIANEKDETLFEQVQEDIKRIKEENGFYDEESMLDIMFPDRHEEDFDEDSMSYDSVFGDDD